MVKIGSNEFEGVAFPLAFEDRYFMLEIVDDMDVWTVFTVHDGAPVIEVLKNKPNKNAITSVETNPTGIVTVSNNAGFLFKLRPGNRNSSIFGSISGRETEIRITDKAITVGGAAFVNNRISGFGVGLMVTSDGGIAMGAGLPAEIYALFNT
jgi:hypothetical protein